jgi:hypothetical protein
MSNTGTYRATLSVDGRDANVVNVSKLPALARMVAAVFRSPTQ